MIRKSTSATIFIADLVIIYACFLGVFIHYQGHVSIPLKGVILMAYIGLAWFIIALNSSIASLNIESKIISVLKDTLIGYSVLSASVIGLVAVFGEFAPNNKLILWPLLLSAGLSSSLRFFLPHHYQTLCQKWVSAKIRSFDRRGPGGRKGDETDLVITQCGL